MFTDKNGNFDVEKMFGMVKTAAVTFGFDLEKEAPGKMAEAIQAIRKLEAEKGGRIAYGLMPLDDNSGFNLMTFLQHATPGKPAEVISQTPITSLEGIVNMIKLFVNANPATPSQSIAAGNDSTNAK